MLAGGTARQGERALDVTREGGARVGWAVHCAWRKRYKSFICLRPQIPLVNLDKSFLFAMPEFYICKWERITSSPCRL